MFALEQQESCYLSLMFIAKMSEAYLQRDYKSSSAVWFSLASSQTSVLEVYSQELKPSEMFQRMVLHIILD
jgi:hypothetical protein